MKIVIFFHTLFWMGDPPQLIPQAIEITRRQMEALHETELLYSASELHVGINGGKESEALQWATIPEKANVVYHGLDSRSENLTIAMIEKWLKENDGEAYILYAHSKGASHPVGDQMRDNWRGCMMRHLIYGWQNCVADLDRGYDAVGCHWMEPPATPPTQYIFAGNFWWAKASFLRTLPSIYERARIKMSGIGALESRYESEVWIGNGPRPPKVRDYHGPGWDMTKVATCQP